MSIVTGGSTLMRNYVNGDWVASSAAESFPVLNPATGEQLGTTPLSTAADVGQAVDAASRAFPAWRRMPVTDRVQFLFKLKAQLERHFDDISRTITLECGKTLAESRGEMRRAVENVEVACGTPILIQGYNSEDIAAGIDEIMIRQPLGVCAVIAPFNFPGMIPFWFLPYAIACGNTVVIKPSERVPLTMQKVFELVNEIGLPPGRAQPGERRQGRRERIARSSSSPVGQLRGVERGCPARLRPRGRRRQTCAMPGRREESGGRPLRRRLRLGRQRHCRQRIWLRRPALPRHVTRHYSGRRARAVSRRDSRPGAVARRRDSASMRACRWDR